MLGCGGMGISIAKNHTNQEKLLRQLIRALQVMECELKYRLTSLPELCRLGGREVSGGLKDVFFHLGRELDRQSSVDADGCMRAALRQSRDIPANVRKLLLQLGRMLGRFDLSGQLQGLDAVKAACQLELQNLSKDRDVRIRSYQTLGLCAGAALVILFA